MLSRALHASFTEATDLRASDRRVLRLEARAATRDGDNTIAVHNLSRTGMLVQSAAPLATGSRFEVELPGGSLHPAEVVWSDSGLLGCRFLRPLSRGQLSAALLKSAPPLTFDTAPQSSLRESTDRLREHWASAPREGPAGELKFPLGTRLWLILALGCASWAVPAAAAFLLF